jgi:hypothetical protein
MKKLLSLAFLLLIMYACQNQQRYTQNSPEIETAKKIINDYDTKNYEIMVTHFADTANIFLNSTTPFKVGKSIEYHTNNDVNYSTRGFLKAGQEYEMVVTDDGKTWVNFWGVWQGTLAANGEQIEVPIHLTIQFIDGKAVTQYGYWDNSPVILALQEIENNIAE